MHIHTPIIYIYTCILYTGHAALRSWTQLDELCYHVRLNAWQIASGQFIPKSFLEVLHRLKSKSRGRTIKSCYCKLAHPVLRIRCCNWPGTSHLRLVASKWQLGSSQKVWFRCLPFIGWNASYFFQGNHHGCMYCRSSNIVGEVRLLLLHYWGAFEALVSTWMYTTEIS